MGDRDSDEWRPCHSSMANDRVFFEPKVSRRKSSDDDEEPILYDSDPDESMRAPDVIRPPPPQPTASARTELQHLGQPEVIAKADNVTKITAIKFGFS